jgi:sugar phosphate isomerase/epimerase
MGRLKLGISNLAWDENIDFSLLKNNNINYIEIILPKHLDWNNCDLTKLNNFIDCAKNNNIDILSTQSILFNSNVNKFHSKNFIDHIETVIDLCNKIGVSKLVLGAPNLRTFEVNLDLINNFCYIDSILKKYNQTLLIEPNSKIYKGNYFYTVSEIIDFIVQNKFSNIKTMIDTHNIILENQNPSELFLKNILYIDHIHISETDLGDFVESNYHSELAETLKNNNYDKLIIYESKPSSNLSKSIELFSKIYNL